MMAAKGLMRGPVQDAFVVPPPTGEGRIGLEAYLQYGYIPRGASGTVGTVTEVVSRSMNYYLSDYAIAQASSMPCSIENGSFTGLQAAKLVGSANDVALLEARAANYTRLFEPTTAFFRSRNMTGQWTTGFDEVSSVFVYLCLRLST
jgi:putative alpha-1,2-mannosidase